MTHQVKSICRRIATYIVLPVTLLTIFLIVLISEDKNIGLFIYRQALSAKMTFTENSILTEELKKERPINIDIYVFNVTNPTAVELSGEKPIVEELGPYTFEIKTSIENLQFLPESTKFQRRISIKFKNTNKNPSLNYKSDMVYLPNIGSITYSSILEGLEYMSFLKNIAHGMIRSFVTGGDNEKEQTTFSPFMNFTIAEIFNGVENELVSTLKEKAENLKINQDMKNLINQTMNTIPSKIGIIPLLSDKLSPFYEVDNGVNSISKVMQIKSIDNETESSCWKHDQFSKIVGGDGIFYPPFTDVSNPPKKLTVYSEEIQRTVQAVYKRKVEYGNVELLRYEFDESVYNVEHNEALEDLCYYNDETHADYCKNSRGTVFMNSCFPENIQHLLPGILLSKPHLQGLYYKIVSPNIRPLFQAKSSPSTGLL